jgi:hypothetical protein
LTTIALLGLLSSMPGLSLSENTLTINFADSQKFGGQHDFTAARNPKHLALLCEAIKSVTDKDITVVEEHQ